MHIKDRLIAEREELVLEQQGLLEEERELTDAEKARDDEINARIQAIDGNLERIRKVELNAENQKQFMKPAENPVIRMPNVEVTPAFEADTKKRGFQYPQDFFGAVLSAYQTGRVDDRLKPLMAKRYGGLMATAGSDEQMTISDPYGGFLVPEGFSPDMLTIRPESDPIGGMTTRVPMANPSLKIPARTDEDHSSSVAGGLTVSRKAETAAATASRMAIHQVNLVAHSLFGFAFATEELLADSAISFTSIVEQGFSDAFGGRILDERINGSGVGEFLGILNSAALISVTSTQTADTIKYANLAGMVARCWGYGNAVWLFNHDCLPQLLEIQDGAGAYIWQPSARDDVPARLFGRPAYPCEYCQTLGDAGDIILVNWAEYLEGIYQPMQGAESIHVRFQENERAFRFSIRNAGVPWWKSALTPAISSTTLSPYVTLAARA